MSSYLMTDERLSTLHKARVEMQMAHFNRSSHANRKEKDDAYYTAWVACGSPSLKQEREYQTTKQEK